jgi:hypothetical protein
LKRGTWAQGKPMIASAASWRGCFGVAAGIVACGVARASGALRSTSPLQAV